MQWLPIDEVHVGFCKVKLHGVSQGVESMSVTTLETSPS